MLPGTRRVYRSSCWRLAAPSKRSPSDCSMVPTTTTDTLEFLVIRVAFTYYPQVRLHLEFLTESVCGSLFALENEVPRVVSTAAG